MILKILYGVLQQAVCFFSPEYAVLRILRSQAEEYGVKTISLGLGNEPKFRFLLSDYLPAKIMCQKEERKKKLIIALRDAPKQTL